MVGLRREGSEANKTRKSRAAGKLRCGTNRCDRRERGREETSIGAERERGVTLKVTSEDASHCKKEKGGRREGSRQQAAAMEAPASAATLHSFLSHCRNDAAAAVSVAVFG